MAMPRDVRAIREDGLLTVSQVAKELGIGQTTLRRLEGTAYPKIPRRGYREFRVYTRDEVEAIQQMAQGEHQPRRRTKPSSARGGRAPGRMQSPHDPALPRHCAANRA